MKKNIILSVIGIVFTFVLFSCKSSSTAATKTEGKSIYTSSMIKSSPQCDMCIVKIEGQVGAMKGVRSVRVNLADKTIAVKYATDKVSLSDIRNKIASIGYDADDVKASEEVYNDLPVCCKKK